MKYLKVFLELFNWFQKKKFTLILSKNNANKNMKTREIYDKYAEAENFVNRRIILIAIY